MSHELITKQFFDAVHDCRRIYVDQSVEAVLGRTDLSENQRDEFLDEVEFRFNRLLIKVFVEVAWSDCFWSHGESRLAVEMIEDLLRTKIPEKEVRATLEQIYEINGQESWQAVLEPFTLLEELQEHRPILEAGLIRMANIVAKIDGNVTEETLGQLKNLKWQLHQFLKPAPVIAPSAKVTRDVNGVVDVLYDAIQNAVKTQTNTPDEQPESNSSAATTSSNQETADHSDVAQSSVSDDPEERAIQLDDAIKELESLIGIESVKSEVKGLVNFLKVQTARTAAGLPENPISMHLVFKGNPGTGKTTVARMFGRIFGAMGVLKKGHLIETDRSGLVAEFVGQTATKANKIIDSALDGVLFIDEAYSLVGDPKDSFGAEAMQILLKRAEDDRDRLIVIMAGYSDEMELLLQTNPGLSSRFARKFEFPDYTPDELSRIFGLLTKKNHYIVSSSVQTKLNEMLVSAVSQKDAHFGNGRLVRNIFEKAIRNLADRIVNIPDLTPELLTTLEASDIEMA